MTPGGTMPSDEAIAGILEGGHRATAEGDDDAVPRRMNDDVVFPAPEESTRRLARMPRRSAAGGAP